jgi:hypothetical protein
MIVFIGDKPSSSMKPGAGPFQGAKCQKRLMEWVRKLAVSEEYMIINQCGFSHWALQNLAVETNQLIALGNNASKALAGLSHFKLPHPSGRNLQNNDADFIAKKLQECAEWLKKGHKQYPKIVTKTSKVFRRTSRRSI